MQSAGLNAQLQVEIAERKRMETELARAQRLESVGHLAAGIAHELNTPVSTLATTFALSSRGLRILRN